jgi:hypothetical protein
MLHNLIAEKLDNMDSNANLQQPQATMLKKNLDTYY